LQANSATGNTLTNSAIQMKVGDSGGTTALTISNNGNVGIGTTAPDRLLTLNKASGDPALGFNIGGVSKFTLGIDDSDSDKFKIAGASALGTTDRLVIDSGGHVQIGKRGPLLTPSYALLPSQGKSEFSGAKNIPFGNPDLSYTEVVNDSYYNAFPGMTMLDDHTLIVVYRKGTSHCSDKGTIVKRTSSDLGKTWSSESTVYSDDTYDVRDPSITKLSGGALIISFFKYDYNALTPLVDGVYVIKSTDNGSSWGSPIQVNSNFTAWAAVSAPVIELLNGDLLLGIYGKTLEILMNQLIQ